jgi:hypothetical protein
MSILVFGDSEDHLLYRMEFGSLWAQGHMLYYVCILRSRVECNMTNICVMIWHVLLHVCRFLVVAGEKSIGHSSPRSSHIKAISLNRHFS